MFSFLFRSANMDGMLGWLAGWGIWNGQWGNGMEQIMGRSCEQIRDGITLF